MPTEGEAGAAAGATAATLQHKVQFGCHSIATATTTAAATTQQQLLQQQLVAAVTEHANCRQHL